MSPRGVQRERAVRDWLLDGSRPRLVEVKSTAGGPYERFGPADRRDLSAAAARAGADALLAWWPPRGVRWWLPEAKWPR